MRQYYFPSALLMGMILVGCGGGSSDVPAKPKFTSQVSFGDSLSDVGSYKVGVVAALGGGQFTINAAAGTPTNWTEMTAAKLGVAAPCAAQTGLDNGTAASGVAAGTVVTVVNNTACTGYAQGGSRITNPVGIGNKLVPVVAPAQPGFALTVPVVTQIANHLAAHGGSFTGSEVVTVMAGANDIFAQLGALKAGATAAATAAVTAAVPAQIPLEIAAGRCTAAQAATTCVTSAITTLTPTVGAAAANSYLATNAPLAVQAVGVAAGELVAAVNAQILAKGAKYVAVVNVPDMGTTPFAATLPASSLSLLNTMVTTFNSILKNGLAANASVLFVDANTASHDETQNPSKYNLTNVIATACNLAAPSNPLASSLACNAGNLTAGVTPADHYLFADSVHPTPYAHLLFATYVLQAMTNKGWY